MTVKPKASPRRHGGAHPGGQVVRLGLGVGLAGLAALFLGPLWTQAGLPNTADGVLHVQRAAAQAWSLEQGLFWPRWFPHVYGGLGGPIFHYYSPLFHRLAGLLHALGTPLDAAVKTVITVGFLAGGLGVAGWLAALLPGTTPGLRLVGMALYLSAPFLFREYYVQGDYPQLMAWLWLPVCLAGVTALYRADRTLWRMGAPLALAVLVLFHHLTAMLAAGFLVGYWLALAWIHPDRAGMGRTLVAGGLGAALAAFYWMPALGDLDWVQIERARNDFFAYTRYWLSWRELLSPVPIMDARAANPPFPHTPGIPVWLVLGAAGLFLALPRTRARLIAWPWTVWGLTVAGLVLFLTTPRADLVWRWLPPLQMLQFPSRLLPLAILAAIPVAGSLIASLPGRGRWVGVVLALTLIAAAAGPLLFPNRPFLPLASVDPAEIARREQTLGTWGTTGSNEFLPVWADLGAVTRPETLARAWPVDWRTPHQGRAEPPPDAPPTSGPVTLRLLYFPAWQATTVDGRPLVLRPSPEGLAQVVQAAGPVSLHWAGTPWQRRGEVASLVGLFLWALWTARGLRRTRLTPPALQADVPPDLARRELVAGVLTLAGLLVARILLARSPQGWFQRYSPPDRILGVAHPLDVPLSLDGRPLVALRGWERLDPDPLRPGASFTVRLYWQPLMPLDVDLASTVHLYTPATRTSWAVGQNEHPGMIPTRHWHPALYYVDPVTVAVPLDTPPATFTLAAALVARDGRRLLPPDNPDGLVFLETVRLEPLRLGPLGAGPRGETSTPAETDAGLFLRGYDLIPAPGGPILRLYWTASGPVHADWTVYVHLIDPQGQRIAQYDGPPLAGLLPTREWRPGRLYVDRRVLTLPEPLPPGGYRFLVGLYRADTGERAAFRPRPEAAAHFQDGALVIEMRVEEGKGR